MKAKLAFWIFVVVAVAQLAVPASMIWQHERVLRHGTVFKFRTAPVDPYDAFRGRYVSLNFEQNHAPAPAGVELHRGQKAFAVVEAGMDGFARFTGLDTRPPTNAPYLTVRVNYQSGVMVYWELPFDRFYMEENVAPVAESAYWEHSRRGATDTYAQVRIRDGTGVIEQLYVANKPIADYLREQKH